MTKEDLNVKNVKKLLKEVKSRIIQSEKEGINLDLAAIAKKYRKSVSLIYKAKEMNIFDDGIVITDDIVKEVIAANRASRSTRSKNRRLKYKDYVNGLKEQIKEYKKLSLRDLSKISSLRSQISKLEDQNKEYLAYIENQIEQLKDLKESKSKLVRSIQILDKEKSVLTLKYNNLVEHADRMELNIHSLRQDIDSLNNLRNNQIIIIKDLVQYIKLPFYKRWFTKPPVVI